LQQYQQDSLSEQNRLSVSPLIENHSPNVQMHLIKKIKSYFTKYEWHSWKDYDSDYYPIKFCEMSDETILDIVSYINRSLQESPVVGNSRHRLKEEKAIRCKNLDHLMLLIRSIIETDFAETKAESLLYSWDFKYVVGEHQACRDTICISNVLTSKSGNCIYALASIRKSEVAYFLWNHLE
jgi:hypothetical protein